MKWTIANVLTFACAFTVAGCAHRMPVPEGVTAYQLVGGRWFDGTEFVGRTMYIVGSTLLAREPERIDSTLDLSGGWIVPPYGDAHTHNLDGIFRFSEVGAAYQSEGTFYVQVLTNNATGAAAVRDSFDVPGALDVRYANAGITSTLGHPFLAYEPRAIGIYTSDQLSARTEELCRSRTRLGNAYWFVDDMSALDEAWPRWLDSRPGILKIFLLHSEDFEREATCAAMGYRGLDPGLVPEIVRRAHAAGLPVWAHIESAHDFEVAVRSGVNGLAHLPGYQKAMSEPDSTYEIDPDVARLAGERGIAVTPTVAIGDVLAGDDTAAANVIRALHKRNIRLLEQEGVKIVVGSDYYGRTARDEVEALRNLGLWSNLELLRIWAVETPGVIFPNRQIGTLEDGSEASFLVLECDPMSEWGCIERIRVRVKDGILAVAAGG